MYEAIIEEELLDSQFGYEPYYDSIPRAGWLLNYHPFKNKCFCWEVNMYFVDSNSDNFKIRIPYYPSFLIECKEELLNIEEYIKKKYEGGIHLTEITERIDTNEYNHLNKSPKKLLKVYFNSDSSFQQCLKDVKEIVAESVMNRHADEIYSDFCRDQRDDDIVFQIIGVHEYDIAIEVQVGNYFDVRCGSWYNVSYNGEEYRMVKNSRITYPDLRVLAFDIETTKPPLKFPNPEFEQIMIISILTEESGELIVNRKVVSQDIQEFEYTAKDDIKGAFHISNEDTEEALLIRFIEFVQEHRPHIITTYNGGFFDWPFIDIRMKKYKLDLNQTTNFTGSNEYYECPFIIHLDCYKWVKRDSYLPMNNQGLKDVTRIKLGYFPDEIDPEDMMRCANEDPQKLASYSVSDAVATYFLYMKYVHSHIFSVCTLIPLSPVQTLCKGTGTICEALLVSEAINYRILIPIKKRMDGLEYYNGHIVENLTYVGGHVESLQAGIFRSDFESQYHVSPEMIEMIVENLDHILVDVVSHPDYLGQKQKYIEQLRSCAGNITSKGHIYHLDVGAMYPNIILTNRLQPISVVNEDVCIRCDYNDKNNNCRKKMKWVSRAEYLPPGKNEISMIRNQLESETFYAWDSDTSKKIPYSKLPRSRQESLLKERVVEYSKNIHKRVKKTEERAQDIYICQREIPFYVETVRKFRDQRYVYKDIYKKAMAEYEKVPSDENKKSLIIYNSLQVAYKCILNSFYGYVMRAGSRWFSLEMAATVCHTGGQIIRLTKELVEHIGIPLELDTDGIWGILPSAFPSTITIGEKSISMLANILNYFVCKKYTNYQYQVLKDGNYETIPQNLIFFEVDGPYKSMVIPSSTEENKLLKKRYVVFDNNNKIVELKGFELKRRGELNFVKKFQEDIFQHFNDGESLQECYDSLASVCNYWLDIIDAKGGSLDDESIFYLFSESRSMSKSLDGYANKKSNILSTAKRLSEFLGAEILEEKLKCEFIISKYPLNAPTVDRAIPVMIFKSTEKDVFLKKWLKSTDDYQLKNIIDWSYYRKRFDSILQRLIVIPAYLQKIKNPVDRIEIPAWIRVNSRKEKLNFTKIEDIEDIAAKTRLDEVFYTEDHVKKIKDAGPAIEEEKNEKIEPVVPGSNTRIPEKQVTSFESIEILELVETFRNTWMSFYRKKISFDMSAVKIDYLGTGSYLIQYLNNKQESRELEREIYLEVADLTHFNGYEVVSKYICDIQSTSNLIKMKVKESEVASERFLRFFDHFSIGRAHNLVDPMYQILERNDVEIEPMDVVTVSSFNYHKRPVFCITYTETVFISDLKHTFVEKISLRSYRDIHLKSINIVVCNRNDPNFKAIHEAFEGCHHMHADLSASLFLDNFENLMRIHNDLHLRFRKEFHQVLDISRLSKIPLLNVDSNALDYMLYKEFIRNGILSTHDHSFSQSVIKEEMNCPGYYPSYCVQFECSNSLILSIIEYKSFVFGSSLYDGYDRRDFQLLRELLKNLVVHALKHNSGARVLLERASSWVKKDSKLICAGLREVINITHQRYLIALVSKLKQQQYNVISASKELIIVETGKKHSDGCNEFIEYVKKKLSSIPGYELLNFKVLRIFERIGFIDSSNYFYVSKSEILSFSEVKMPLQFFKLYFSENEIKNDEVYDLVKHMDCTAIRMLLRLLSYKRDVHGLASNCYKLVGANEFSVVTPIEFDLVIFCKNCGLENILRKKCLKCYSVIEKEHIERECLEYLRYCWKMQIDSDKYCNKCGIHEERRLKEYCRCGGKFIKKDYIDEINKLKQFVNTRSFDEKVQLVLDYFCP